MLTQSLLSTDAQKFKTKFEECRKEIEEREKKGDMVPLGVARVGGRASLQIHSASGCISSLVLFLSAKETFQGAVTASAYGGHAAVWGHVIPWRL